MVPTKKPPTLHQKATKNVPKKNPSLPKNTLSTKKPPAFPMCATLVDRCVPKKKQLGCPPLVLKNPGMGYLGVSSFPPLSATFRSTTRSTFFAVKTFHYSLLLLLCCHLPFRSFPVAHLLLQPPPPPLQCALWIFSGTSFTMGGFFFRGLKVSPLQHPPPPAAPICAHLCDISSPYIATSCGQYARKAASNEGEIQQPTEIRLDNCSVPFHNDPAEIW